jgi:predicted dinucleotide-binding enzyme
MIGTGHIGGTLAGHFVAAGHEVAVSNSRGPETLAGLVEELGGRAQAMTAAEAARVGDVIVVSVPFGRYASSRRRASQARSWSTRTITS